MRHQRRKRQFRLLLRLLCRFRNQLGKLSLQLLRQPLLRSCPAQLWCLCICAAHRLQGLSLRPSLRQVSLRLHRRRLILRQRLHRRRLILRQARRRLSRRTSRAAE